MQRYKLTLEYDGTYFNGWQKQKNLPSVQETLEKAIFAFTHEDAEVYGAGRTDKGVHALQQVAHTDFAKPMTEFAIREALNFYTRDKGVTTLKVEKVSADFHARFSAKRRSYFYSIVIRDTPLVIDRNRAWRVLGPLDIATMREAAEHFKGTQDFSSFRAADCQAKSPMRTLDSLHIEEALDLFGNSIKIHVMAQSFLHHQVRNMVGALKMVGEGKWTPQDLKRALEAKDRSQGGVMAPAEGLYLASVLY